MILDEKDIIYPESVEFACSRIDLLVNQAVIQNSVLFYGSYMQRSRLVSALLMLNMQLSISADDSFQSNDLGVDSFRVISQASAQAAMTEIDTAINSVATAVNEPGIYQT